MVKIRIYVEGGGESKALRSSCRRGFGKFIERSGLKGSMPRIVASGSRSNVYERFKMRHERAAEKDESVLLLVDSEGPVGEATSWPHLKDRDGWDRPDGATDDQCHLMVQVMESWFLADREALGEFYGQGFKENALPANQKIEQVHKRDVLNGLNSAARSTTKGSYNKGSHSFEILAKIDPTKVTDASPHARQFINVLVGLAEG